MAQLGEEVRKIRFKAGCSLAGLGLSIAAVRIVEAISTPFQITLELSGSTAPKDISISSLLGSDAGVAITDDHHWHGILSSFSYVSADPSAGENIHTYRATIVPKLWRLTLNARHQVFQEMSTADIVQQVFSASGLSAPKNSSLANKGLREYCSQFDETDLDFITRLLAEEGISYRFDHSQSQSEMALVKAPDGQPIEITSDSVSNLSFQSTLHTGSVETYEHDDNSFTTVKYSAKSTSPVADKSTQMWAYGRSRFNKADPYHALDNAHADADSKSFIAHFEGSAQGAHCSFDGAPLSETKYFKCLPGTQIKGLDPLDKFAPTGTKLVVLHRELSFSEGYEGGLTGSVRLECAQAIDYWVPPVPERPRPLGPCVGIVIDLKASESDGSVDSQRLLKVKFPWSDNGLESCWLRSVQAYAGRGWGASFVPRLNQEVLIEFLNGDIDRPVVVGALYNGKNNGPEYTRTQSGFKTENNELRFDDKSGEEEIYLEAGKNFNYQVNENKSGTVEKDYTLTVNKDQKVTVQGTRTDKTTQAHSVESDETIKLKVGGCSIEITTSGITIEAMGNKITLDSGGVAVKGTTLKLNSDSTAELKANAKVSVEGSAMAELKSSGMTTVKGSMTMIN